jgi:DSF synthase
MKESYSWGEQSPIEWLTMGEDIMSDLTAERHPAGSINATTPPYADRDPDRTRAEETPLVGNVPPEAGWSEHTVRSYANVDVCHEPERGIYWQFMRPQARPCYTHALMADAKAALEQARHVADRRPTALRYLVSGSRVPGIFNLGGDLPHFNALIRRRDRAGLRAYARACIEVQHARATKMDRTYVSIALVQGDALGGGFECALTDDVIIAEKGAKFGLPEVMFGLFPGMGAYSFLARKVGDALAERMILSGRLYTAEELHDMGLVTRLADTGAGKAEVDRFIREDQRSFRARTALSRIRQRVSPISFDELNDIAEIWVQTALSLGEPELRKMERLATAQERRWRQICANWSEAPSDLGSHADAFVRAA